MSVETDNMKLAAALGRLLTDVDSVVGGGDPNPFAASRPSQEFEAAGPDKPPLRMGELQAKIASIRQAISTNDVALVGRAAQLVRDFALAITLRV